MTQTIERAEVDEVPQSAHRWRWVAFGAALSAMVIDRLDATVVNVAAPAIRGSLGGSYSDLQWTAAAYTLAMAVTLLVGGRLGDMFGRKLMLLVGVSGFTVASVLCALAGSQTQLIWFRAIQGACAAIMLPQVFGLVRDIFPLSEQRRAWTALGPVIGLATVLGPVVGGFLINADLFGTGWRMIFLVNLPIGIAVVAVGAKLIPKTPPTLQSKRLDIFGVLLAGVGMFLLVYPLVQGREQGWSNTIKLMLVGSVVTLAAFGWYQVRRKRSGRSTLVEPGPFRKRSFVSGIIFALSFLVAVGGFVLMFGVFIQLGLFYTPLHASLTMLPWAFGAFVGSAFSAAFMSKLDRGVIHLGLGLMGAGLIWLYLVLESSGMAVTGLDFALPLLVSGSGMGMVFVPMFDMILRGLANHEVGSASATLKAVQQLGMALGVAIIGTVFFSLLGSNPDHVTDFLNAARHTALVAIGMIAISFVVAFFLPKSAEQ